MDRRLITAINDVLDADGLQDVARGGVIAAGAGPAVQKRILAGAAKGTAGTGARISSLWGAAAEKATLARLGGGTKMAGGGGIARGEQVLSRTALFTRLAIFGITATPTVVKIARRYSQLVRDDRRLASAASAEEAASVAGTAETTPGA
jgi:hypothetical protein